MDITQNDSVSNCKSNVNVFFGIAPYEHPTLPTAGGDVHTQETRPFREDFRVCQSISILNQFNDLDS